MAPEALMPSAEVPERVAEGASRVVNTWTGMAPAPGVVSLVRVKSAELRSRVLRRRQQRLLRTLLHGRDDIQTIRCAAAGTEARHRLHELAHLTRAGHRCGGCAWRIGGKPAE